MPGRVVVFGSFMMDLIAYAPRRPLAGETIVGTGFSMLVGGKGFNQAVAARRAGAATAMIGRIGTDAFGDEFIAFLRTEGIDASGVVRDPTLGTGVGLPVVESTGANSIVIVPRANTATSPADAEAAEGTIAAADVLLLQLEVPVDASAAAARIARAAGTTVVLNPAPGAQVPDELSREVDILVPNEVEAADLLRIAPEALDPVAAAGQLVDGWHLRALLLTLGSRGALLSVDGALHTIAPHRVDPIDTVGAGDTFCGALAAALAEGRPLLQAAQFASVAAGLSVTRPGGAPAAPFLSEIVEAAGPSPASPVTHREAP
jgi:ribokinase